MHVTALGNKPIPHGISTAPAHRIHYTTPRTSHRDRLSGEREADKGCNSGGQEKKVIGLSRKQLKAHETNGTAHRTPHTTHDTRHMTHHAPHNLMFGKREVKGYHSGRGDRRSGAYLD